MDVGLRVISWYCDGALVTFNNLGWAGMKTSMIEM